MTKEIAFETGHFCTFQTSVTLTLDQVIRHTVVYHSSTSIYTPNFVQIGNNFFFDGRTYGRTLRPALLGRFRQVDLKSMSCKITSIFVNFLTFNGKVKKFINSNSSCQSSHTCDKRTVMTMDGTSASSSISSTTAFYKHIINTTLACFGLSLPASNLRKGQMAS